MVFRFRLERVLWWRQEMERKAMVDLARTMAKRDLVASELRALKGQMDSARSWWQELRGKQSAAGELLWMRDRWRHLSLEARRQEELLRQCEERVTEAQEKWLHVRRAEQAMEKLRQRALEGFLRGLHRADTQAMDEASLRMYLAKASSMEGENRDSHGAEGG